ncbi:hypothetical protein [Scytonema sp. UIC 10036]|uniref:hypothetical protein n=1 Tax=Scytonema sp. UIC 10036 TaxID=2304196 RepID=UPI00140FE78A|nr:hypothetical protein [Scytonema sp. UIC 10036]
MIEGWNEVFSCEGRTGKDKDGLWDAIAHGRIGVVETSSVGKRSIFPTAGILTLYAKPSHKREKYKVSV